MDISDQLNVTQEEVEPFLELTTALVQKRRSQGRIIFDRFIRNRAAIVGAIFLILLFLFCFLGPTVTGHNNPDAINVTSLTATFAGPSAQFPFGTDYVGRDELARAMAGGHGSLLVGLRSMLVGILFCIGVGSFRGEFCGVGLNSLSQCRYVLCGVALLT